MKWSGPYTRTTWTTKDRRQSSAPAITTLGRVVRQQIEAGGNEIDKLKLSNRTHALHPRPKSCPDDRAFRDRRIDDALFAKLVEQAIGNLERAAIRADVLADHKHA